MNYNLNHILGIIGVVALLCALAGCSDDRNIKTRQTTINDGNIIDQTVLDSLRNAQPIPVYNYSTEREQLIKRHNLWNEPNTISYIALINQGKVFRYVVAKGKVSSLNSLLTSPQQLVQRNLSGGGYTCEIMPSPDLDGSYGDNPQGIFFWTTAGEYCEWGGQGACYMLSSRPFSLQTPPEVTMTVH